MPEYSDISDSETTVNSSTGSVESKPNYANGEKFGCQLPYLDHQYSRISFYGSGENEAPPTPTVIENNEKSSQAAQKGTHKCSKRAVNSLLKSESEPMPNLVPVNVTYRLTEPNIIRQTTPAFYIRNLIPNASTASSAPVPIPTIIRPIPQRHHSVVVTSSVPMTFNAPLNIWPTPMMQQPLYYIQFCEQKHQHLPNNLL